MRLFKLLLLLLLTCAFTTSSFAIGSFKLGLTTGYHPNPNNIMHASPMDGGGNQPVSQTADYIAKTEFYNRLIHTSDGKGQQLGNPVGIPFGFTFRYSINNLLMRVAFEHTFQFFGGSGSITPSGGSTNEIDISTGSTMIPVSFGFIFSRSKSHIFYIALGPVYAHSQVEVTNSKPSELEKVLPASQQNLAYSTFFYEGKGLGFHYLIGMEVPFNKKLSFSLEFMGIEGQTVTEQALTKESSSDDEFFEESLGQNIEFSGYKILFGVNYQIML